jgi:hypothetical protein
VPVDGRAGGELWGARRMGWPPKIGGVLELRDADTATIEITKPELGPAARIVFAPLRKLRVVEPARRG